MISISKEEIIDIANETMITRIEVNKARRILSDLVEDYGLGTDGLTDSIKKKLEYESERLLLYVQMAFDYIVNVDDGITKIDKIVNS